MADESLAGMRPLNYQVMYEVEDEHWWFVGRRAVVFAQIEEALAPGPAAPRQVLDIGCGTGANLDHLARYGAAQGVDVSALALGFCRRRGHERVMCASATELPFAAASFDLVTALDVIEHLEDDHLGLSEVRRVLKPGAPAVIFVPAFEALWGPNDDQSGHKRRYRRAGLRAAVEGAGLRVERLSYANAGMFLPIWLGRQLLKLAGRVGQAENRINHPLVNRLLARVFAGEAGWLRRRTLPFGVSLVCVARKEAP